MRGAAPGGEPGLRPISRRGLVVGGLQAALMGGLALRMRQIQVKQAEDFRLLADENRIVIRLLPPDRGLILDRNGVVVADNAQDYRVVVVKEDAPDMDEILERLGRLLPLSAGDVARVREETDRRSPFVPVTVADRLSWEEFARVAANAPALPGVTPLVGTSRFYPLEKDFAHLAGYVGPVSDFDLTRGDLRDDDDPLLQIDKFQVGKSGVEARLEQSLRGQAGTRRIEVNAVGRVMRELGRQEGLEGASVQLTADTALQNYVQARLLAEPASESASAVVVDAWTGDILAMASAPSFDPNKFVHGISSAEFRVLQDEDLRPQVNKAVQGVYPPGSTFKMITALAALESGAATPSDTVFCRGFLTLGNRRFHCWKREGHGRVDLVDGLTRSCDVYFYEMARKAGIEEISSIARMLGFDQRFDLPLPYIQPGLAPTKSWKQANRPEEPQWLVGDTLNASIGQGFVLASPLQLAVMTARLATGLAVAPRLVNTVDGVERPAAEAGELDVDPRHLAAVREGMFNVVNHARGTARSSRIVAEGMRMAGKTGTSQVRSVVVRNEDVPWNQRDHALFVGFAPHDSPRYACSVVVEHGGSGSRAAAPIARDILLQALHGGAPPLTAYPESQRTRIRALRESLDLRSPAARDGRKRV